MTRTFCKSFLFLALFEKSVRVVTKARINHSGFILCMCGGVVGKVEKARRATKCFSLFLAYSSYLCSNRVGTCADISRFEQVDGKRPC